MYNNQLGPYSLHILWFTLIILSKHIIWVKFSTSYVRINRNNCINYWLFIFEIIQIIFAYGKNGKICQIFQVWKYCQIRQISNLTVQGPFFKNSIVAE